MHNTSATVTLTIVAALDGVHPKAGLVFACRWRTSVAGLGAEAFDTGRVNLFGSWRLIRAGSWKLFGCYLLSFFLYLVLALLTLTIMAAVTHGLRRRRRHGNGLPGRT